MEVQMNGGRDTKQLADESRKPPPVQLRMILLSTLVFLLIAGVTTAYLGNLSNDVVAYDRLQARTQLEDLQTNLYYFLGSQSTLGKFITISESESSVLHESRTLYDLVPDIIQLTSSSGALRAGAHMIHGTIVETWSVSQGDQTNTISQILQKVCTQENHEGRFICGPYRVEGSESWIISYLPIEHGHAIALGYDFGALLEQMGYADIPPSLSLLPSMGHAR